MATKIEVLKATILSLGGSFDDIDATDEAALSKRLIEVCGKLQNPGGGGGSGSGNDLSMVMYVNIDEVDNSTMEQNFNIYKDAGLSERMSFAEALEILSNGTPRLDIGGMFLYYPTFIAIDNEGVNVLTFVSLGLGGVVSGLLLFSDSNI